MGGMGGKKTAGGGIQVERGGVVGVFGEENSKTHQNMRVYTKIYVLLSLCYSFLSELAASSLIIPTMFKPPKRMYIYSRRSWLERDHVAPCVPRLGRSLGAGIKPVAASLPRGPSNRNNLNLFTFGTGSFLGIAIHYLNKERKSGAGLSTVGNQSIGGWCNYMALALVIAH